MWEGRVKSFPGFLAKAELNGEREWEERGALGGNDVQCNMLGLRCLWGSHLQMSSRLLDIIGLRIHETDAVWRHTFRNHSTLTYPL